MTDKIEKNNSERVKKIAKLVGLYAVIVLALLLLLIPFYVLFISSFKTLAESYEEFTWWPKVFTGEAYRFILTGSALGLSFPRAFLNTLIIAVPTTIVGLFVSSMSAFIFAKYKFVGREIAFALLLSTMMIPGAVTMMPSYIIYSQIGWTGTYLPLMLPAMFGGATCVFFMRQFISGIPTDLIEAAELDGMNKFRIFISIIFPLSAPALIAQGLLLFIGSYNDYFGPLIYCQESDRFTLQVLLSEFNTMSGSAAGKNIPVIMAGSVICMLPLWIIYIFTQKFFISGITVSGLKA